MGRMLKNTVFKSGSYALGIPSGTNSVGPDAPQLGQTRYNTQRNKLEFYANIAGSLDWHAFAAEGNAVVTTTNFTGDGANVRFGPLNNSYSSGQESQVLVHVGTVYQIPGTNYEFYGNTTIGFLSTPSLGAAITVVEGIASSKARTA